MLRDALSWFVFKKEAALKSGPSEGWPFTYDMAWDLHERAQHAFMNQEDLLVSGDANIRILSAATATFVGQAPHYDYPFKEYDGLVDKVAKRWRALKRKPNPRRNARRHGKVRSMREILDEEKLSKPKMTELIQSGEQISPSRKRRLSKERRASEKASKLPSRRRSRKVVRDIYVPEEGEEISLIEEGTGDVTTAIVKDVYEGDDPSMWIRIGRAQRYLKHDDQDFWYVLKSAATRIREDTPRHRLQTGVVFVREREPMVFNPSGTEVDPRELREWDPRTVSIYQKLRMWIQDPLTAPSDRDTYVRMLKEIVEIMESPRSNPSKLRSITKRVQAASGKNPSDQLPDVLQRWIDDEGVRVDEMVEGRDIRKRRNALKRNQYLTDVLSETWGQISPHGMSGEELYDRVSAVRTDPTERGTVSWSARKLRELGLTDYAGGRWVVK